MNLKKIKDNVLWTRKIKVSNINDIANLLNRLNIAEDKYDLVRNFLEEHSSESPINVALSTDKGNYNDYIDLGGIFLIII